MNKKYLLFLLLILFVSIFFIGRAAFAIEPITSCDPVNGVTPLCNWQNPEDITPLPDGRHIIVSEYGGMNGEKSGTIALLNLETESRTVLYDGNGLNQPGPWGAEDCIEPQGRSFSPHGIHLSQRADGTLQLFAVQHSGRESVEMFEVKNDLNDWSVEWRGCAIPPKGSTLNDVVGLSDGSFLVTHMMTKRSNGLGQFAEFFKASALNIDGGHVLAWQPNSGFKQLPNSAGAMTNGIEISADESSVFVNYSLSGELRRINIESGEIEAINSELPPLDNASWSPDGKLLVAGALTESFGDMVVMMGCENIESGSCPGPFVIIEVDPNTLAGKPIYKADAETPGGAGTVGVQLNDGSLLVGTFAGDRILQISAALVNDHSK